MALPGETTCRPVASCPAADGDPWAGIPVERGKTVYVSGAVGDDLVADGTTVQPFKTIQAAITFATSGDLVAIAKGTYAEALDIDDKLVRLWGVCPASVEVVGPSDSIPAIWIHSGSDGTELHRLAIRGSHAGVVVTASENLTFSQIWVHDTASFGISLESHNTNNPIGATLKDSLVEDATYIGVFAFRASSGGSIDVRVESTTVRSTALSLGNDGSGIGIDFAAEDAGQPATGSVEHSVVEDNFSAGIYVQGMPVDISDSVIRGTRFDTSDNFGNAGVTTFGSASISLRQSYVADNELRGVRVEPGGHVAIASTVIRATKAPDGYNAFGLWVDGATASIDDSVVDDTQGGGITARQSRIDVTTTVVRDTDPSFCVDGVNLAGDDQAVITSSLIENVCDAGISVWDGSTLSLQASVVRGTRSNKDAENGMGVFVGRADTTQPSSFTEISRSLVELNRSAGIYVVESSATIDASTVRDTLPRVSDRESGVGVVLFGLDAPSAPGDPQFTLTISRSLISANHTAGAAVFGASAALHVASSAVSDTLLEEASSLGGFGVWAGSGLQSGSASTLRVNGSLLERNRSAGIFATVSDVTVDRTAVVDTGVDTNAALGDAVLVVSNYFHTEDACAATVTASLLATSKGAGLAAWGCDVKLVRTTLADDALDIRIEDLALDGAVKAASLTVEDVVCTKNDVVMDECKRWGSGSPVNGPDVPNAP